MNIDPKYKAWASVALTTFAGAAVTYLTTALGSGIPPQDQWKAIVVGAVIAGVSAVIHLLQTPPAVASAAYKAARRPPTYGDRGFASIGSLALAAALGLLAIAAPVLLPGCVPGAVPSAFAAGSCEYDLLQKHLSLGDFLAQSVVQCGADWLALFTDILAKKDPALGLYFDEANKTNADPARMAALKAHVEGRVAAMKAGK